MENPGYGGYAGLADPNNPDELDIELYETTLSGDLNGNDGPGPFENNEENSYHVTMSSGCDETAVLSGFIITAGSSNGYGAEPGAGMYNRIGSPTLTNCIFHRNSAVWAAGMYNRLASPTLLNCDFIENLATDSGAGGMYSTSSSPLLFGCTFIGNECDQSGLTSDGEQSVARPLAESVWQGDRAKV